jgi:hypothetical protein
MPIGQHRVDERERTRMIKRTEENADMMGTRAALFRAARRACERAKRHGLPVAIWRDGKVVRVPPEEVLAELDAREHDTSP